MATVGDYALAICDITGEAPLEPGLVGRLPFLDCHGSIRRLELAFEPTIDRTTVLSRL